MKEQKICYINYINKKHNNGEIRHDDFESEYFEYRNIVEIKDTYEDEPILLMDFVSKYSYLYDIMIINMNNVDKDMEELILNKIEAVAEYLISYLGLKVPKIIYINRNKSLNKVYKPL